MTISVDKNLFVKETLICDKSLDIIKRDNFNGEHREYTVLSIPFRTPTLLYNSIGSIGVLNGMASSVKAFFPHAFFSFKEKCQEGNTQTLQLHIFYKMNILNKHKKWGKEKIK